MPAPTFDPIDIPVLGMTCASCVRRVETAIASLDVDVVVGLSNLNDQDGRRAASLPGLDLVLATKGSTHDQT